MIAGLSVDMRPSQARLQGSLSLRNIAFESPDARSPFPIEPRLPEQAAKFWLWCSAKHSQKRFNVAAMALP